MIAQPRGARSAATSRRSAAAVARQRAQRPGAIVSALKISGRRRRGAGVEAASAAARFSRRGTSAARVTTMNRVCVASWSRRCSSRIDFETPRRARPPAARDAPAMRYFSSTRRSTCIHSRAASGISSSRSAWPVGAVSTTMTSSRRARRRPRGCRTARRCRAARDRSARGRSPTPGSRHRRRPGRRRGPQRSRTPRPPTRSRRAPIRGARAARRARPPRPARGPAGSGGRRGSRARGIADRALNTSASECAGSVDSSSTCRDASARASRSAAAARGGGLADPALSAEEQERCAV